MKFRIFMLMLLGLVTFSVGSYSSPVTVKTDVRKYCTVEKEVSSAIAVEINNLVSEDISPTSYLKHSFINYTTFISEKSVPALVNLDEDSPGGAEVREYIFTFGVTPEYIKLPSYWYKERLVSSAVQEPYNCSSGKSIHLRS